MSSVSGYFVFICLVIGLFFLLICYLYKCDLSWCWPSLLFIVPCRPSPPFPETVNHKPVIHRIQNDTITRGSNYTVNCTAVSSAHNHVQWYKGFCYDDCSNKTSNDNVILIKVFSMVSMVYFLSLSLPLSFLTPCKIVIKTISIVVD